MYNEETLGFNDNGVTVAEITVLQEDFEKARKFKELRVGGGLGKTCPVAQALQRMGIKFEQVLYHAIQMKDGTYWAFSSEGKDFNFNYDFREYDKLNFPCTLKITKLSKAVAQKLFE